MAAIFGRFSRNSQAVLEEAQRVAERLQRPVRTDAVLLAMLSQSRGTATDLLKNMGATYTRLFEQLAPSDLTEQDGSRSAEVQLLLEESIKLAAKFRFVSVEVEHLLYVIAREERFSGHAVLARAGIEPGQVVIRLSEWLFSVSMLAQQRNEGGRPAADEEESEQPQRMRGGRDQRSELEKFTVDVSEMAEDGELDPVVGRADEIERMVRILLRRRKNNPLLLGEPGVGKTALVDGLALRIAAKQVPKALIAKRVLTLDLSLVVAGTMYRGQFEERLKNVINEVQERGDVILFVDELHTLSGTGSAEGGFDAANILKPALARGELSLIGATTYEEYRRTILKDKALDRRFQTIAVGEPTVEQAVEMLRGSRPALEEHHGVQISDEAVRAAVDLSTRYVHDRFLPDKAIDVLDEAASLHAEPYEEDGEAGRLQQELALVSQQKMEAVEKAETDDEYAYAHALAEKEKQLMKELQKRKKTEGGRAVPKIGAADVAGIIAARTGIPLADIIQAMGDLDVARVRSVLKEHVLGQDEAANRIGQALLRARLGLKPAGKPIGSFLLVGPTGVGKTETARTLAREVFGDAKALIKVDMSEFMERHTVSNLVGAPAGYVGYESGGTLTEQVRRRPYAVVLFDEVEKAHPDIFNLLLQILEDGALSDNTGRRISFENTLVLMTSNIGMASFTQAARIGFETHSGDELAASKQRTEELERHIDKELKEFFRPELLGRLSGVIYFQPLGRDVVERLAERRLESFKSLLKEKSVELKVGAGVAAWLAGRYEPASGARSLDRLFLTVVEPRVVDALVGKPDSRKVSLTVKNKELTAAA